MVKPIGVEWAKRIAESQEMYPEAMREEEETFVRLLQSPFCWAEFIGSHGGRPVGWILFEPNDRALIQPKQVYCYDCAVLPAYQGQGIMKKLTAHAYSELRWLGYWIRMHCRRGSYPSPAFLFRYGYEIAHDRFIENHYGKEYETEALNEDGRELLLKPIGQG